MEISYPLAPEFIGKTNHYKNFKKNWDYSHKILTEINRRLTEAFPNENSFCITTAGSYGRMEASPESDLDFVIFLNENATIKDLEIRTAVRKIAKELDIPLPNEQGVFSQPIAKRDLIDNIGGADDNLTKLAQRMLLLMETKPLFNEDLYKEIVDEILKKYLEYVINDPNKEALFLMNDLMRYFRSIAVNYQYNFWKDNQKWTLRNVKLRHSRILMYSGLLLIILNASKERKDKFEYIKEHIFFTPIEKIACVYIDNKDYNFTRLIGAYDIFLAKLNDKKIRKELQVDYQDRYNNPYYAELKVTSDAFSSELTRFIFAQRNNWSEAAFEYLLF